MNIVELIKNAENILIVGHLRPDGDCFGAGLTLLRLCEIYKKNAYFVCDSELSPSYSFMHGYDKVNIFEKKKFDLLLVVDCGDKTRMGKYKEYLTRAKISVNIDHHLTNNGYAAINYVYKSKSSTCQVLYELLKGDAVIDSVMARCLYVGLSTDTGHFMHNTVDADVFSMAAKLSELGADPHAVADRLYRNRTINKTKLIAKAIQSLKFFEDEKACYISMFLDDFTECGCSLADTEGIIDYAVSISGVSVAFCIAEQKNSMFKIGLRSKGVNVSNVAAVFGGGGHSRAAGCVAFGFYEDVIDKLKRAISLEMADEGNS